MKNFKEGCDRTKAALTRGNRTGALQFAKAYGLSSRARVAAGLSPKLLLDEKARRVAALRAATGISLNHSVGGSYSATRIVRH